MNQPSPKIIERLFLYRRCLFMLKENEMNQIFSHELARLSGVSSAQLRRDLMVIGYSGSPTNGYNKLALLKALNNYLDANEKEGVALVGLGDVGRAILHYFQGRRPSLEISAVFDNDPQKIGRVFSGCKTYSVDQIKEIVQANNIHVGVIAVPEQAAQQVADELVDAGVRGILNYAPVRLDIPDGVYLENRDVLVSIEKIAYFARQV